MNLRALQFPYIVIKMKLSPIPDKKEGLQVFWLGSGSPEVSDAASVRVDTIPDGQFHTYVLPMRKNPRWKGIIQMLSIVPCSTPGVEVSIQEIRLAKERP
jgi:hypothetical protein